MPSVGNNYLTPKGSILCIDDIPVCPPAPRAPSKLVGDRDLNLHQDRLSDTLLGFFLETPNSGSNFTPEQEVQFKSNHMNQLLLQPKESSLPSSKYRVSLQPRGKSIDWAAGAPLQPQL